jgi:mRNA interferase YafQ
MLTINRTSRFKKDYKRELKGRHGATLEKEFQQLLLQLLTAAPLKEKYRDHPLTGEWQNHRDLHIKPDLVLIYRKTGNEILHLVRLGSHSELGL